MKRLVRLERDSWWIGGRCAVSREWRKKRVLRLLDVAVDELVDYLKRWRFQKAARGHPLDALGPASPFSAGKGHAPWA